MRAVYCPVCGRMSVPHVNDDSLFCWVHGFLSAYWRRRLDGMSAIDRIIEWHADVGRREIAHMAAMARDELVWESEPAL